MNSIKSDADKILNGCNGKTNRLCKGVAFYNCGDFNIEIVGNEKILCPTCQAIRQAKLECWKEEKEFLGLKSNTVRKKGTDEDLRFQLLDGFISGNIDDLKIRIIKKDTTESFTRQIKDVSIWEGIYIISW